MAAVNGNRLALQKKYHMDDRQTNAYQKKTSNNLKASNPRAFAAGDEAQAARDAVTYATLNHPVIRDKVIEAVIGIHLVSRRCWCPSSSSLKNWSSATPMCAARSPRKSIDFPHRILSCSGFSTRPLPWSDRPLMILLGFVIILISGGITVLFSSKFKENLEDLRKRQGRCPGAEVNTTGRDRLGVSAWA